MMRYGFILKPSLAVMILFLSFAYQPCLAADSAATVSGGGQEIAQKQDSQDIANAHFSKDEVKSIAAALPEGEARQIFEKKFAGSSGTASALGGDELRTGEGASQYFAKGVGAVSHARKKLYSFLTASHNHRGEWKAAIINLNQGQGFGHLMLTVLIAVLLVIIGLSAERLVKRSTASLRRQLLEKAQLGRLRFLGRVTSNLFLDLLGFGAYLATTFLLCAFIYDETGPGFLVVSIVLVPSYYIKFLILAAKFGLAPSAPALRMFPMPDEDAGFLYRWTIRLAIAGIGVASIAYLFKQAGISQDLFFLLYALSGLVVNFLLVVMLWRSRNRVARAILPAAAAGNMDHGSMRAAFAKSWHFFAILYVIIIGIYWFMNALAGRGAILELIIILFLIPLFIGIDQWLHKLLKIATGELPETIDFNEDAKDESGDKTAAKDKPEIRQYVPLIRVVLRIILVISFFFAVLRLWGIDLPIGHIFTHTAFSIVGALMLGYIGWQYIKTLIDRKLNEELPDDDVQMEEGSAGGSRTATLLLLLRKFVLAVMTVMISLIVLSSIGINIGPLIAGAGVIGLAIGFGAQTLVKDIISGIFFLIDDAFRAGDYIETAGTKGMVEHISLRSLSLRHPRGPVFTIPFGEMGTVKNNSRDYIITKLDFRVRYDTNVDKVRKIIKNINKKIQKHEEMGPVMLGKIKSQGVRELDDSAMIMRVKFKTIPGEQFVVRREVFRLMQEAFHDNGIEFAHRNVTVYLPSEKTEETEGEEAVKTSALDKKTIETAGAAAAIAAVQAEEEKKTPNK